MDAAPSWGIARLASAFGGGKRNTPPPLTTTPPKLGAGAATEGGLLEAEGLVFGSNALNGGWPPSTLTSGATTTHTPGRSSGLSGGATSRTPPLHPKSSPREPHEPTPTKFNPGKPPGDDE